MIVQFQVQRTDRTDQQPWCTYRTGQKPARTD
jgi:hypothetical protein